MMLTVSTFLRRALSIDAAISGLTALLLILAGGAIAQRVGLPEALLRYAGLGLVPFALGVGALARRDVVSRGSVVTVIALNIIWVAASVWLALGDVVRPNALGYAFIIVQAIAVAGFAELQYMALRKATSPIGAT